MYKLKLGTSVKPSEGFAETLAELKKNGFYSYDYDLCAFWREEEKRKKLFSISKKNSTLPRPSA